MSINERLEAYRRKKYKEKMMETIKNSVTNVISWNHNNGSEKSAGELTKDEEVKLCEHMDIQDAEDVSSEENVQQSKNLDQNDRVSLVLILSLIRIVKLYKGHLTRRNLKKK
ncbi:hypothetical protein ACFW04_002103 [Cataglyphis niger]